MKKTDHVYRRKTHGFAVETNGLYAVIVIQCNGSTQTLVLRVISMRKNCPQFKPSVPKHNLFRQRRPVGTVAVPTGIG